MPFARAPVCMTTRIIVTHWLWGGYERHSPKEDTYLLLLMSTAKGPYSFGAMPASESVNACLFRLRPEYLALPATFSLS